MMIFDVNIGLGRIAGSRGRYFRETGELLTAMDRFGISRALVYSMLARETDCEKGNSQLLQDIAGSTRLSPCWVAVPGRKKPETLIAEMNRQDIRVLRLFPQSGHFSIRPWCIRPLAERLEQNRKLLLIDFESLSWGNDGTDWEGVYRLCKEFPKLSVIVCGVTIAGPANYGYLINECKNLHIEISQLSNPGEIKELVESGHGKQVLFGSALPVRHPGSVISMLQKASISPQDRQDILAGNIVELLQLPLTDFPVDQPVISQFETIIDTHVHLGGWNHSVAGSGEPDAVLREMDRCGITSSILTSLWSCYGDVVSGNQAVAETCGNYPGRFYGYLTLDPKDSEEVRREIKTYDSNPSMVGIKLHCGTHGYNLGEMACRRILEYADAKEIAVLVHGSFMPQDWVGICEKYPNAKFIVAHLGGCGPDMLAAVDLARACRKLGNLYFDLAASRAFYGFLNDLIELAGADRILFGSDHPIFDFGYELGQILYSDITVDDKARILYKNAHSVFKLP